MNLQQVKPWVPFVFASVLTFLVYKTLWASDWYYAYLSLLGVLSAVMAARLFLQTGIERWPVAGVTIGLLFGQWWLVEALILRAFWRINGFAP